VKEWRKKKYVFGYFYLIWKDWIICLLIHKWNQNQVVHSQKLFGGLGYFLEFLKIVLRRGKRPQDMRENKMRLVKFYLQEKKTKSNMNIKLIKHLIKKIKGKKKHLG